MIVNPGYAKARAIAARRKSLGLTQNQVAVALKTSRGPIGKFENGRASLDSHLGMLYAVLLGVLTPQQLFSLAVHS